MNKPLRIATCPFGHNLFRIYMQIFADLIFHINLRPVFHAVFRAVSGHNWSVIKNILCFNFTPSLPIEVASPLKDLTLIFRPSFYAVLGPSCHEVEAILTWFKPIYRCKLWGRICKFSGHLHARFWASFRQFLFHYRMILSPLPSAFCAKFTR